MDVPDVRQWFAAYLADFAALGRGDLEGAERLLLHYGVPLLLSTDAAYAAFVDQAQVLAFCQRQVLDLRAVGYHRSKQRAAETVVLNRSCAVHRAELTRLRADGTEIARFEATYLITDGPRGRRINAIVVHSAP